VRSVGEEYVANKAEQRHPWGKAEILGISASEIRTGQPWRPAQADNPGGLRNRPAST